MKSTVADLIQHLQTLDPDHSVIASIWSVEDLNYALAEAWGGNELTEDQVYSIDNLKLWEGDVSKMIESWFEGMTSEINNEIYLAILRKGQGA